MEAMTKPALIIDFDDTLTALPDVWREAIAIARQSGVRVLCLTQRPHTESDVDEIDEWLEEHKISIPVYFTGGMSKTRYIKNELEITRYILCDDNPVWAVNGV
jgi:hypothetical protein